MRTYYKKNKAELSQQRLKSYYRVRYGIDDEGDIREFKKHSACYRELMKHSAEEVAAPVNGSECHWKLVDALKGLNDINKELLGRLREFRKAADS